MSIKHPVLKPKPELCQHPDCSAVPQVWFKGKWICMDHAEQEGLGK